MPFMRIDERRRRALNDHFNTSSSTHALQLSKVQSLHFLQLAAMNLAISTVRFAPVKSISRTVRRHLFNTLITERSVS